MINLYTSIRSAAVRIFSNHEPSKKRQHRLSLLRTKIPFKNSPPPPGTTYRCQFYQGHVKIPEQNILIGLWIRLTCTTRLCQQVCMYVFRVTISRRFNINNEDLPKISQGFRKIKKKFKKPTVSLTNRNLFFFTRIQENFPRVRTALGKTTLTRLSTGSRRILHFALTRGG